MKRDTNYLLGHRPKVERHDTTRPIPNTTASIALTALFMIAFLLCPSFFGRSRLYTFRLLLCPLPVTHP
jgi:hypothetical protein